MAGNWTNEKIEDLLEHYEEVKYNLILYATFSALC